MKKILLLMLLFASMLMAAEIESAIPVKLYGFVRMEAFYDNTEMAQGDWMLFARPGNSAAADESIFSMSARHTRLGLRLGGPVADEETSINGLVEVDFAGGFPNSSTAARQPQLRLRHAWVEIAKPEWELRLGQDWALISGPFPHTTSFVVGAGKGHLWMRYPQIKYTVKRSSFKLALSANRPMAGNIKYDDYAAGDFDPVGDGERTGLPWIMGRVWLNPGNATLSLSGHLGKEQISDLSGAQHDKTTFSVNADIVLKTGPVSWTARAFMGENLNSFFGGVFQGYVRDDKSVTNIASTGGWGQAVIDINERWDFTLGGGIDDPDNEDLAGNGRGKNTWLFSNVAMNYNKNLSFMLEADYLQTEYLETDDGENLRLHFVTFLKF